MVVTIKYRTVNKTKTVKSDGIIYDYDPYYYQPHKILRGIRDGLANVWTSLLTLNNYQNVLRFNFRPNKSTYNLDESVNILYELTSLVNYDVVLNFATTAQCGFIIYKDGKKVVDFPDGAYMMPTNWTIPAFQTVSKNIIWNQFLEDTSGQIGPKTKAGKYTIAQYIVDNNSTFYFSEIVISEEGPPLHSRIVQNYSFPITFTYELNNRISRPFVFNFSSDKKVGFVVKRVNGSIVFADTSLYGQPSRLELKPLEDFRLNITWNRTDNNGNPVSRTRYIIEISFWNKHPIVVLRWITIFFSAIYYKC